MVSDGVTVNMKLFIRARSSCDVDKENCLENKCKELNVTGSSTHDKPIWNFQDDSS